jgi:hypothetical protein
MGTITRSFANNLTTGGVLKADAFNNASLNNVTALNAAIATGNMILLSSQTASNSASISFTTGINSTYKEYQFWFVDIHPRTDNVQFQFNLSTDSGSSYNVTKTSTLFSAYHYENDAGASLDYNASRDLAQSTAFQSMTAYGNGSGADESLAGSMSLFNPASTTYVKHFIANTNNYDTDSQSGLPVNNFCAGYGNTTSAINAVQFKMDSGNFDGTILMYGIN